MAKGRVKKPPLVTYNGMTWEHVLEAEEVLRRVVEAGGLPAQGEIGAPRTGPLAVAARAYCQRTARDILGRENIYGDIEVVVAEPKSEGRTRLQYLVLRRVILEPNGA